jgi:cell division protein FtsZ
MNLEAPSPVASTVDRRPRVKIIGLGGAGLQAVEHMQRLGLSGAALAAVHTDARLLAQSPLGEKLLLGAEVTRGLKAGEPEVGRALAEAEAHRLRHLCEGADLVLVVAGLGGNTASGTAPVLARVARENGPLVLALAVLPFDFEGRRRQEQAQAALRLLRTTADAVICLPNQKVAALLDEKTSLPEAMRIVNDLLAQGVGGLLRLLTGEGLIRVDFADLCRVVRGRQAESSFATAEASGENRAREVVDRLVGSPLLDHGRLLAEADAMLVSVTGGPELSLKEIHLIMDQFHRLSDHAQVIMGAAIDPGLAGRVVVTLIAARHPPADPGESRPSPSADEPTAEANPPTTDFPTRPRPEEASQLLGDRPARGHSRYVAPPPELTPEQAEQLLARQQGGTIRRRQRQKLQQGLLPLEVVSKGRFAKSEPTVHHGENLDTPTYVRRGIPLN